MSGGYAFRKFLQKSKISAESVPLSAEMYTFLQKFVEG
jgi:hypothetical protein